MKIFKLQTCFRRRAAPPATASRTGVDNPMYEAGTNFDNRGYEPSKAQYQDVVVHDPAAYVAPNGGTAEVPTYADFTTDETAYGNLPDLDC